MGKESPNPEQVQRLIDRLQSGDASAQNELLASSCDQLRRLTRKMFQDFGCLKPWEQTDDVLQNALLRLWAALQQVTPRSARDYFGLAALQIRRELQDLVRQYFGPEGMGAHHGLPPENAAADSTPQVAGDRPDSTYEPSRLAVWTEFHQWVDGLAAEDREIFDLLVYQEVPQAEAAALLGLSERTLRRRWVALRQRMHQALKGKFPGL